MENVFKISVIVVLLFIVASLFQAMFFLARDDGNRDKTRVVKALTVRVVLSLTLFALLIVGHFAGLIQPNGL